MPTTNAVCNIGVTSGDGLAGEFYWDSSSVASTNTDTFQTSFPGLEITGRWIRLSGGSGANGVAAITSGTIAGTTQSGNAITTDTLSGTNVVLNFSDSTYLTPGASASRFNFSNIPTGTNEQRCYVTIIGNPGDIVTNVVDSIFWHGAWGVLNELTNKFLFVWNGSVIEGFQDFNHFVISPAQLVANTDNWNPPALSVADEIRIDASTPINLTGIVGRSGGLDLTLHNTSANTVTLKNNVTSTATNRFLANADVALAQNQSIKINYDLASSRWRVIGGIGSGSGSTAPVTFDGSGNIGAVNSMAVIKGALGTTVADGVSLVNSTAAAAGAQQISSSTHWGGQGWKTAATAASQPVDFIGYVLPVQGSGNPTAKFTLAASVNGSAYSTGFTLDNAGAGIFSTTVTVGSSSGFLVSGRSAVKSSADGLFEFFNAAGNNFTRVNFGGTSASFPALKVSGTTLQHRLADDSADGPMSASAGIFSGGVTVGAAMTFPDGVRQTFNPDSTIPGLNVGANAGDPSTPSNGDLWYDSTGNLLRARINGATVSLSAGGGSGTAGTIINSGTPVIGNVPRYTDTTGTNVAPSQVVFNGSGDISAINSITVTNTTAVTGSYETNGVKTYYKSALGTTTTDGIVLTNTTVAAVGAQQISPSFHWGGSGWKTSATAAAQPVDFIAYVLPVQGAGNPTAKWTLSASVNGSAYANALTYDNSGNLAATAGIVAGSSSTFQLSGRSGMKSSVNAEIEFVDAAGTSPSAISFSRKILSKTSNYPVLLTDSGRVLNNVGAGGSVNFTLPTAAVGLQFEFVITDAQTMTITAAASTTIRIAGTASASAGNITANSVGNTIRLVATSTTAWIAMSHEGTWTIN